MAAKILGEEGEWVGGLSRSALSLPLFDIPYPTEALFVLGFLLGVTEPLESVL